MDPHPPFTLAEPGAPGEFDLVRRLMREYETWLGVNLCFQGFERELAGLPGEYAPPSGRLLLALAGVEAAGCVALRRQDADSGEMKRLYVSPTHRGKGLGGTLARAVIAAAQDIGYARVVLDTLPKMPEALALYRSLGFRDIPPYYHNPISGALYLELRIR